MEKDLEILKKYINLINKGYCDDCNELNCIDNFPHKEIAQAIKHLIQAYKEQQAELEKKEKIVNKALEIAFQYAQIDGDHHKAWVIDQIVRHLTGEGYKEWVKHYEYDEETGDEYTWSEGIAP